MKTKKSYRISYFLNEVPLMSSTTVYNSFRKAINQAQTTCDSSNHNIKFLIVNAL